MIETTLCYIESDDQYLMLHRTKKKNDCNHDKWQGVGGHFEPGENAEQCALREIWEETGLTATEFRYRALVHFHSDQWDSEDMHLFTVTGFTGDIKICDEGDLEWVSKSRVMELAMWEGDRIFLRLLEEDAPFFELTLKYQGNQLIFAALDGKELPVGH